MQTVNDYKSVVVIGAFNPAILTPNFLYDCCGFSSDHKPEGQNTPVASEIRFGNSHFLMELNRFQISIQNPVSFEGVFPLDVAKRYLDVLEYTPISLFGVNLNYRLKETNVAQMKELFGNPWSLSDRLKLDLMSFTIDFQKPNGSDLEVHEIVFRHMLDSELKNNVRVVFDGDDVAVNNNFEVDRIDSDRDRISILIDRHENVLRANHTLLQTLSEVGK